MKNEKLPQIIVAEEQFDELADIAERLSDVLPDVSNFLDRELNRAKIVPIDNVPGNVVKVNSTVEFIMTGKSKPEKLKLVYPTEQTSDDGCVSIASPVGVALLGMEEGQSISWTTRYGETRSLTVSKVG